MPRLLLPISLVLIFAACGSGSSEGEPDTNSTDTLQIVQDSTIAGDSSFPRDTVMKIDPADPNAPMSPEKGKPSDDLEESKETPMEEGIESPKHESPEQAKIDSIKEAKKKLKEGKTP